MNDHVYMGIDPSTKSGVVVLDHQGVVLDAKIVQFAEAKGFHRLHLIAKSMVSLVKEWNPTHVVVEGLAYGNKHTLVIMVQTGTIVRQALYSAGISWYDVPPTKLKKWLTGKGTANKAAIAKVVKERWGFESNSDDVVDAYMMAQYARSAELDPKTFVPYSDSSEM